MLAKIRLFCNFVKQLTAVAQPIENIRSLAVVNLWESGSDCTDLEIINLLGNQEVSFLVLKKFVKLQYIWMVQRFQDLDLVQQRLFVLLAQGQFIYYLHSS